MKLNMEEFRVLEEEFSCLDYVVIREAVQKNKTKLQKWTQEAYLPLAEGRLLDRSLFWESKAASLKRGC